MEAKKNMKKDLERKGKRNYLCLPVSREKIGTEKSLLYLVFKL